ncbi:hypothetical protein DRN34_03240 [Thermococci archaeon]|nr:MAG: hypothetical protein DRN34_03240 [Thermococci archaeon]
MANFNGEEEIELHPKLAEEELSSALLLLENNKLRDAISRAYYSIKLPKNSSQLALKLLLT